MKLSYFLIGIILVGLLIGTVQATDYNTSSNATAYNTVGNQYTGDVFGRLRDNDLSLYAAYRTTKTEWSIGYNFSQKAKMDKIRWFSVGITSRIQNFHVQRSDDFSTWTNVTITGVTDNSTDLGTGVDAQTTDINGWQGVTFTELGAQYWRLVFTTFWAGGDDSNGLSEITIYGTDIPTVASFTTNVTSGVDPLPVLLTNTSSGAPVSFKYGAKNVTGNDTWIPIGILPNQEFTFPIGNWSLNLTTTNVVGSNISTQITHVNVSSGILTPIVAFTTNVTSGVNPLVLYLNDTSTQSPTMWNTSWGDDYWTNQTSFPPTNITHLYSTAGTYAINEYATNIYGTANGTPLLITVYGTANANFSLFNTAGTAPFTTYLYDTSTNTTPGPATYSWMFGDGNTSTSQNVFFTWNITGTYSVNHSFSNGLSTSWYNKSAYITVGTATIEPVASFYGGPQIGAPPLQVFFTDVSTNTPTSWLWVFGDGTSSTSQNPTKWYNSSGFFTVNLTATNTAGSNKTSQNDFIMVY